jgi:hypothetical protein
MIRFIALLLLTAPLYAQEKNLSDNPFLPAVEQAITAKKPLEALNQLEAAKQKLWDAMPLTIKNAAFVKDEPQGYGLYKLREGTSFESQEPILIYAELLGYGAKPIEALFKTEITLDFILKTKAGKPILSQEHFNTITSLAKTASKELFLSLSFTFSGLEAGEYLVTTTIRDKATGKQTELDSDFKITK